MHAVFTKQAQWSVPVITEDEELDYELIEDTEEAREEARTNGFKFVHLFEEKTDDYDQIFYAFVTSQIL